MALSVGDTIPNVKLATLTADGLKPVESGEVLGKGKVVLFAVPGAFTPTCSEKHLPGFVEHFDAFRDKGIGVACLSVNDPFVMQAWGQSQHVPDELLMLADGHGDFTRALGLEMDASAYGMGTRAKRFAIYAEDGVARKVLVEAPGEFRVSSAEYVLSQIP